MHIQKSIHKVFTLLLTIIFLVGIMPVSATAATTVPIAAPPTFSSEHFYCYYVDNDNNLWHYSRQNNTRTHVTQNIVATFGGTSGTAQFLTTDGKLLMGGANGSGRLGNGTTTEVIGVANWVTVMDNVAYFTMGDETSFAIQADGSLWGWGNNEYYQLGDSTTTNRLLPVKIMDNVAYIRSEATRVFAIKKDGSLWAWGTRSPLLSGDGKTPAKQMDDIISVETGYSGDMWVIKSDNSVWTWNQYSKTPRKVGDDALAVAATTGSTHAYGVLKTDGSVWKAAKADLSDLHNAMEGCVAIIADAHDILATKSDGTVWAVEMNFRDHAPENTKWADNVKLPRGIAATTSAPAATSTASVAEIQARFEKWYTNDLVVVDAKQGENTVTTTVQNPVFTNYNVAANTITTLNVQYTVGNGSITFTTPTSGIVVISEGMLTK